jgi:SAM-dependent methyltransferase
MALTDWVPPVDGGRLARNGYALLDHLEDPAYQQIVAAMEGFQCEFLAATRSVWEPEFPIPGDALSHFSRQWEYPYVWANLGPRRGRVLDAGSGITFFPFLLAAAGLEVDCCDWDGSLGLLERYQRAGALSGHRPRFSDCSLADLPFPEATFDAVACVSVLEHVAGERRAILDSIARVLRPGGRLVLTCDVDLWRQDGMLLEDAAAVLAELTAAFRPVFTLDLRRPPSLLTSEVFAASQSWRLPWPWRPPGNGEFRSIAILGMTFERRDG